MFAVFKRKLAEKRANDRAVNESNRWKENEHLRACLQAMRGGCTVAPMEMHEAVIAVVNIALRENVWTESAADFTGETVYIVWNIETLPVLKTTWALAEENLHTIRSVAGDTFLVAETMDRALWFDSNGSIKAYSIA